MKARSGDITPVVISEATAFPATGLTDRQYRAFVRDNDVPHVKYKRLTLVRVEHLFAALDRLSGAGEAPRPSPPWDEEAIVAIAARKKPRGSVK